MHSLVLWLRVIMDIRREVVDRKVRVSLAFA
jgi:hypothetical protein